MQQNIKSSWVFEDSRKVTNEEIGMIITKRPAAAAGAAWTLPAVVPVNNTAAAAAAFDEGKIPLMAAPQFPTLAHPTLI